MDVGVTVGDARCYATHACVYMQLMLNAINFFQGCPVVIRGDGAQRTRLRMVNFTNFYILNKLCFGVSSRVPQNSLSVSFPRYTQATRVVQVIGTWLELLRTQLRTYPRFCAMVSCVLADCSTFPPAVLKILEDFLSSRLRILIGIFTTE